MARPLRIEYPGAFYHILARGQRKDLIVYSDNDHEEFFGRLKETAQKYHLRIHAYVLMHNHYHLLLETPNGNLAKAMHYFNASYTNYFRTKHRLVGSVFQGRYKSILVEKDAYLLGLSAYIHLNPVRAGMTKTPEEFRRSSYHAYGETTQKNFPYTQEILAMVGGNKAYWKFVSSRIGRLVTKEEIYGKNSILGGEGFNLSCLRRLGERKRYPESAEREITELRRLRNAKEEDIRRAIRERFGVDENKLVERTRGNIYRKLYLYGLKKHTAMSLKDIGKLAGMDYAAVSELVRRFVRESGTNKEIREMVAFFEKALTKNITFNIET